MLRAALTRPGRPVRCPLPLRGLLCSLLGLCGSAAGLPARPPIPAPQTAATGTHAGAGDTLLDAPWQALMERRPDDAARQLTDLLLRPEHAARALEMRALRGLALLRAGRPAEALPDLEAVAAADPVAEPLAAQAAFRLAEALLALDRPEEAVAATEQVTRALRAPARRRRVVELYTQAAREELARLSPAGDPAPDHATAFQLLAKARELGALATDTPEGVLLRLDLLRCADALGQPPAARDDLARELLEAPGLGAAERSETLFLAGRAAFAAGRPQQARDLLLEAAAGAVPGAARALDLLLREIAKAPLPEGARTAWMEGAAARLAAEHAGDPLVPEALLVLALWQAAREPLHERALATFDRLLTVHPASPAAGEALLARARLLFANGRRQEAVDGLRAALDARPADTTFASATMLLRDLSFQAGAELRARAQARPVPERGPLLAEAGRWFDAFIAAAPDDPRVPAALLDKAQLDALGLRLQQAVAGWRSLAERFPAAAQADAARVLAAQLLIDELADEEAGRDLLRRVSADGPSGADARRLLHELETPLLRLASERPQSTSAAARVTLETRNLERVSLSFYAVDLAELFLAAGGIDGVMALDVGLIKPDRQVEVEVADYRPRRRCVQAVEIDLGGEPGAWVIAARAGLHEARTLLLRTDLELLAVASAAGVRPFVVPGPAAPADAAVTTRVAVDGQLVAQDAVELPASGSHVNVFSSSGAGAALVALEHPGPRPAPEPLAAGWLLLDRETVRPGERVRALGVVRPAPGERGDGGTEPEPPACALEWHDGRLVTTEVLALDAEGGFIAEFQVDGALEGEHRIVARLVTRGREPLVLAEAAFSAGRYPEPVLALAREQRLAPLFAGDAATLPVVLRDGNGQPLVRERVRVAAGGDPLGDARTDDAGRVFLEILPRHTIAAAEDGVLALEVEALGARRATWVQVLPRVKGLRVEGPLGDGLPALAGEPYAADFRLAGGDGGPPRGAPGDVRWRVVELRPLDGAAESREVPFAATGPDAAGRGTLRFTPPAAGTLRISAEWTDGFGAPASRAWNVTVAGDGDGTAVHLLPARLDPEPGTDLALRIHSEAAPGPALLLVHSDRLESALPITLERGLNSFDVAIPVQPVANLRVTCALVQDGELLLPTVLLAPRTRLAADLALSGGSVAPGAELEVTLTLEQAVAGGSVHLMAFAEDEAEAFFARFNDPAQAFTRAAADAGITVGASAALRLPNVQETLDPAVERALGAIRREGELGHSAVMARPLDLQNLVPSQQDLLFEEKGISAAIGLGGGAGGKSSGRYGGRYGGRSSSKKEEAEARFLRGPVLFLPALPLGAGGRFATRLRAPEQPGRYVLIALVAAAGRFAVASEPFVAAADLAVELEAAEVVPLDAAAPGRPAPAAATTVRVRLENGGAASRALDLRLVHEPPGQAARSLARALELAPGAAGAAAFELTGLVPGRHEVALEVDGRTLERSLLVVERRTEASVSSGQGATSIALPAAAVSAVLQLDASPRAALFALAAESAAADDPRDHETAALRLLLAAEALVLRPGDPARRAALERLAGERLVHLQQFLPGLIGDRAALPLALVAAARAQDAGLPVPADLLRDCQRGVLRQLPDALSARRRLFLLFAAGFAGAREPAMQNRLFRERAGFDPLERALLAWLCADLEEFERARMLLGELLDDGLEVRDGGLHLGAMARDGGPLETDEEVVALALAAAARAGLVDDRLGALRAWSWSHRAGAGLGPPLAAILLLAHAGAAPVAGGSATAPGRVEVRAGGRLLATVDLDGPDQSATVPLDAAALASGGSLELSAANDAALSWRLAAQVPVASAAAAAGLPVASRRLIRSFALRDGRRYAIGESVLRPGERRQVPPETTAAAPGRPVTVAWSVLWNDAPPGAHWFFEALPGGVELRGPILGAEHVVRAPEGVWFRLRRANERQLEGAVSYTLLPEHEGLWSFGPARHALGRHGPRRPLAVQGAAELLVREAGADLDAEHEPSPDERLQFATALAAAGAHRRALELLRPLPDLPLDAEPRQQVLRLALLAAVADPDSAAETVRLFEILKEHDPTFVVPFAAMIAVGAAYREIGEPARAQKIQRAVADASFLEEAQVVGQLEATGRPARALAAAERLVQEYGDTEAVRATQFALGQHALDMAKDPQPRPVAAEEERLDPDGLFAIAARTLTAHLAASRGGAEDAATTLTLASALVDMGRTAAGRRLAEFGAGAHEGSELRSSFDYLAAYAALAAEDLDAALARAGQLAEAGPERDGDRLVRELKAMARHMIAQIHHARGDLDAARASYRLVKEQFADAARALDWLDRRGLEVPAVTVVHGDAPVELEVTHKGTAADGRDLLVSAYPVDLRLLYLKHRSFERLADVRLEGIAPARTQTVPLGGGDPTRSIATRVRLDLPAAGAWLLLLRAGENYARGMVIRSDLRLEAAADGDVLRVHVQNVRAGGPERGALVTFVASASREFATQRTDLRGIAEAAGLLGRPAVIAERNGHYAFYQGETALDAAGPQVQQERKRIEQAAQAEPLEKSLEQMQEVLKDAAKRAADEWTENTNRVQLGVEVERARK